MIQSAEEFKRLRESDSPEEYKRASHENAPIPVWMNVLMKYPHLAFWVAHNKTIPLAVLYKLAEHPEERVREMVARKRKIDAHLFDILKDDPSEGVRHALICNTKLSHEQKNRVNTTDSDWLKEMLKARTDIDTR